MSNTVAVAHEQVQQHDSLGSDRLFYVIAASMMLIFTAIGFRPFYLHGKGIGGGEMTSQIVTLIVVHGLAMFGWVILFFLQSILILAGNRRLHMFIGPAGAVLAGVIVVLGSIVAALSVHFNPELYGPFGGAKPFLAIMFTEMVGFGSFVSLGMKYRRRVEVHRPMMLLATMFIISGSLGRCPYIGNLAVIPPLYVYLPMLLLAGMLFLLQWGMTRVMNRWYAFGFAGTVAACLVSIVVGRSALWASVLGSFVR
jgi:hypothetical protein